MIESVGPDTTEAEFVEASVALNMQAVDQALRELRREGARFEVLQKARSQAEAVLRDHFRRAYPLAARDAAFAAGLATLH